MISLSDIEIVIDHIWNSCIAIIHSEKYIEKWDEYISIALIDLDIEYEFEDEHEIVNTIIEYIDSLIIQRSVPSIATHIPIDVATNTIQNLRKRNASLPKQRTEEWYAVRNNMISASNLWKALGTEASKNQLIYEKCVPKNHNPNTSMNLNSSLHWGVKYEPVAQMYYEYVYDTIIEEFGCLPHPTYSFIGASPDGLNVKPNNDRYGRLLEIKCIVNREITQVPKKEYWIQMQIQMECCNIDECDFLECRFKEYENESAFLEDGGDSMKTNNGAYKGVILCFDGPVYEYKPFHEAYETWNETMMDHTNKNWIKTIFWYIEEVSCVCVPRNRDWFREHFNTIETIWNTIVFEREHGCEHRQPNKNKNKEKKQIVNIIKMDI